MRICLVLEGCYPFINGGVSTWMHQYITEMPEHEFVLWVIGAKSEDKDKFVYTLPENVVEVKQVFLDDALRVKDSGIFNHIFTEEEKETLMYFLKRLNMNIADNEMTKDDFKKILNGGDR